MCQNPALKNGGNNTIPKASSSTCSIKVNKVSVSGRLKLKFIAVASGNSERIDYWYSK
jgi:hypothetical protein